MPHLYKCEIARFLSCFSPRALPARAQGPAHWTYSSLRLTEAQLVTWQANWSEHSKVNAIPHLYKCEIARLVGCPSPRPLTVHGQDSDALDLCFAASHERSSRHAPCHWAECSEVKTIPHLYKCEIAPFGGCPSPRLLTADRQESATFDLCVVATDERSSRHVPCHWSERPGGKTISHLYKCEIARFRRCPSPRPPAARSQCHWLSDRSAVPRR